MRTLTFFNHAGGAAKTSLALNVGHALSMEGYRVLLIDLDPQANLSTWLGHSMVTDNQTAFQTAINSEARLPTPQIVHGMRLIPSNLHLALSEGQMMAQEGSTLNLRFALEELKGDYDVVLVDSPPSLGKLAVLAALAADLLIVPVPTRAKGLNGLPGVAAALNTYRRLRPDLRVGLFVPTLYDGRNTHDREVLEALRRQIQPLAAPLSYRPATWNDSAGVGEPILVYAPNSPAAAEVQALTREIAIIAGLEKQVHHG
ncbi:ParA family protein [Deinococcus deserti]|uniref:Putative chromosome partitioning ATPase, ParA family n=1 Tax=Deinococcus deserti (strain DSM 17065 / CIP 109153 / LMG 22923 / VCD115) TaxID=546414 RepID=C1D2L3_DEIDV|nr:ParA family protein [Deinococcus deserti]ACO47652.2 putative chromosome partitioning ATPase, ParA family [Deinococcus deserti VCD115]